MTKNLFIYSDLGKRLYLLTKHLGKPNRICEIANIEWRLNNIRWILKFVRTTSQIVNFLFSHKLFTGKLNFSVCHIPALYQTSSCNSPKSPHPRQIHAKISQTKCLNPHPYPKPWKTIKKHWLNVLNTLKMIIKLMAFNLLQN